MNSHIILRDALLLISSVPLVYYLLASGAAWRFFRAVRKTPERGSSADFLPPISILKPLHGIDFASYENYSSLCLQDYPQYEILFAVGDPADPAVLLIRRLIAEFPQRSIRLFIVQDKTGANGKVCSLVKLAREAQYDILALSDGDVRVTPKYLRNVVAPFADNKVGAVTSLYRSIAQKNLGAELEAIRAFSDFSAGVLMANLIEGKKGLNFALGASIVTTKEWLAKIGGFESLVDILADDYELGRRIARAGGKVVLSSEIVWTMYPAQTARGFWDHQIRWGRTVRLCRPFSYFGLIFTHGLPWALLAAAIAPSPSIAVAYLFAYLLLR